MKLTKQRGKNLGIIGAGATGLSAFKALDGVARRLVIWDDSEQGREKIDSLGRAGLCRPLDDIDAWSSLDGIIFSPGFSAQHPAFALARKYNIPILSDISMLLEENPKAKVIAITGTNGKSTTTSLIGHICAQAGLEYYVGGNIGIPVLDLPLDAKGYILELSSFQLELLDNLAADIGILLNITPDHLDRYESLKDYCDAKFKIFGTKSLNIIGIDSDITEGFFANTQQHHSRKLLPISSRKNLEQGLYSHDGKIIDNLFSANNEHGNIYVIPENISLHGRHNDENKLASFAAAKFLGIKDEVIMQAIASFKGLKHRMQYVGTKKGARYFNDSKATNSSAAYASLAALNDIFWLAGGIFKEQNLEPLRPVLSNIRKAYLFGRDKKIFADFLAANNIEYQLFDGMNEAFTKASLEAQAFSGSANILLAPACSSYDQFDNFEERGDIFIKLYEESK
jgi:UDP-N-acetylmuramoylalanine--D-glutamate ligase